jgi:transcriptional regulator GlxA family with amidase domain
MAYLNSKSNGPSTVRADLSVAFVLLPDFTLSTFSGFVDALRIAADDADRSRQLHCRWTILGADRTPARSSCGVEITPWETFGDTLAFDYTVVVGGLVRGHERIDKRTLNYLKRVDESGGSLIGVCTGSFALARAGLMKGYRCCVHWRHLRDYIEAFPDHPVTADTLYLIDTRRITCAGGQSAIDVAAYLVERHCGRSIALKVVGSMLLTTARGPKQPQPHPETAWFREIKSNLVQRAILMMEAYSLNQRTAASEVAAKLGVSNRTLVRAFKKTFDVSPSAFYRALRMAHGRWELFNTDKPIGRIGIDHGFSDAAHFTRLFRKYYRMTPAQARTARRAKRSARRPTQSSAKRIPALDRILFGETLPITVADWPPDSSMQGWPPPAAQVRSADHSRAS